MEIRQLEAFAAVITAGSVTAAGKLLDRSQPVVSRQVQELEQELGFKLFTRTRPQVTLTEQGRDFYQEVRPLLVNLEMLEVRSREIAQGGMRPLRLASSRSLSVGLVPQVLAQLEATQPLFKQKLSCETVSTDQIVSLVREAKVDVAMTSLPLDTEACTVHWSGQAPMLLALPANHPLARFEQIPLADISDTVLISILNHNGLRHRQASALQRAVTTAESVRHIAVSTTADAMMLVAQGVGASLVDPFTANGLRFAEVVVRPIDVYIPYMMGVITLADRPIRPDAQLLITAMKEYVKSHILRFVFGDGDGLPSSHDPFDHRR